MPNYIIYCRKSSESEERQVLSIESQINELRQLTKRLNLSVSEVLTESQSAKNPGRPVFGSLMKRVCRGEVKGIISWKLDRLARNPVDGGELVMALDRKQIEEIITPNNHLYNNSNDKFLMQLEFGMAKKYVDDLSDNVKRGNRMKLERGWLPGLPPIGYLNEPRERTIIPDPDRFTLVRRMWDYLLQGTSPVIIHRMATSEWHLRAPVGRRNKGAPMSLSGVYKLFRNPFYYGLIERSEGVYQGKHEQMITEGEYWKGQELLGRKGRPKPKAHKFAFTGLMKCSECGGSITAEEKINRYGSHYTYYRCTKKIRSVKCSQKTIRAEELEKQMLAYLERIHIPQQLVDLAFLQLQEQVKIEGQRELDRTESFKKSYADCARRLENLNQMRLRELIGDEEYIKEKRRLLDEKIKLQGMIGGDQQNSGTVQERTINTLQIARDALERFQKGTPEEKKGLFLEIGSNFLLKDRKLCIQAEKQFSMIENVLPMLVSQNERLELSENCTTTRELALSHANVQLWWALVEDVRTFFERESREERDSIPYAA